ncbi:MAG: 2-oxoacid:acceptor oxidoreductase family protein [Candidatus Kaelpia aquatica]|nr:2-oxoacid:acceptor oxidoreductase family protein [Candidatus Kaelpia aquatica]
MKEVTVYARAGQGAITTVVILGSAYFKQQKFAYAFPHFGAARMGAPMNAFIRVDEKPIRVRSRVYEPDFALVIDATLISSQDVFASVKELGLVIINSEKEYSSDRNLKIFSIPANDIALEATGKPLGNTAILGAYAALSGELNIENIKNAVSERFKGEVGQKNAEAAQRGYDFALALKT